MPFWEIVKEAVLPVAFLGVAGFLLTNTYNSYKERQGLKWVQVTRGAPAAPTRREVIRIYRLGDSIPQVDVIAAVDRSVATDQGVVIEGGDLKRYEQSLCGTLFDFCSGERVGVEGGRLIRDIPGGDKTYTYSVKNLEPGWVYELTVNLRSTKDAPFGGWGGLQFRHLGPPLSVIPDKRGLTFNDQVTLHLNTVAWVVFLLTLVAAYAVWRGWRRFMRSKQLL